MALQNWVRVALTKYALGAGSITELAEYAGKRRTTLSIHANSPQGRQFIEQVRREHLDDLKRSAIALGKKAHNRLNEALDADGDSASIARVALDTLDRLGLLGDLTLTEAEATSSDDALDKLKSKVIQIKDGRPAA